MNKANENLRRIPSIDQLMEWLERSNPIESEDHSISYKIRVELLRQAVDCVRQHLKTQDGGDRAVADVDSIRDLIKDSYQRKMQELFRVKLKKAINATGVVLHTNLGRAPLSQRARECVNEIMQGYCTLEYDLKQGQRGERYSHVEDRLCKLTGAEAALAVNNNAAAVLLTLSGLAQGREVIVSRGELVEIGGTFRIPDVIRQSGAKLIEVGTTNKTHLADYVAAISDNTAAILKVHPSNFQMSGFTAHPPEEELCRLASEKGLISINDLGSGTLLPTGKGKAAEPTAQECLQAGFDLVTFSGDKLLGAGQAGLIVGKKRWVDILKKAPLLRAVRIDKLSLAALEGTLIDYMTGLAEERIPLWRLMSQSEDELKAKAEKLAQECDNVRKAGWEVRVVETASLSGGGALPGTELPSFGVEILPRGAKLNNLGRELRLLETPIICMTREEALIFDVRCLGDDDISTIGEQLAEISQRCRQ